MRYGIKSITMDDVAKELSISKKTIYQYVSDKDDLVKKTMLLKIQSMDVQCMRVISEEENAILQILKIAEMMIGQLKEMNPSLLFDLKKYHPETFEFFNAHRESSTQNQLKSNIRLGIEQGLYRPDLNLDIVVSFYVVLIEASLSSELSTLNSISFTEKYNYLLDYHMRAICTEKGLAFIKDYKNQNNFHTQL